ncbi:vWA domain-containing protein [Catenuloplanes sp. NPDC051500]|uniref:vWA domain-containing protein n=1 Tax=Catenuloplanes sp. NPDC051500 TaxID=3363959 RepID=UPI003790DB11
MTVLRRLVAALAATATISLVAASAIPVRADDRVDMYTRLGITDVAADFLFLVDKSGSMDSSYDSLKASIKALTASLDDDDRIAIVQFDDAPRPPAPWLPARSPEATAAIEGLPAATSSATDFYEVLDWAVDLLGTDTDRVGTVLLLTDGDPDVPGNARCELGDTERWTGLRERADLLAKARPINAYALPVAVDGKYCPEITPQSVLGEAFAGAQTFEPTSAQTPADLRQTKDAARARKAQRVLEDRGELTRQVTVGWSGRPLRFDPTDDRAEVEITLGTTGVAPIVVEELTGVLDVVITDRTGANPRQLPATAETGGGRIEPDRPLEATMTVEWPAASGAVQTDEVSVTGTLTLTARLSSPYLAMAGGGLAQRAQLSLADGAAPVEGSGRRGLPGAFWLVVAVLLASVFVVVVLRALRSRPTMSGAVETLTPDGVTATVEVDRLRRAATTLTLAGRVEQVDFRSLRDGGITITFVSRTDATGQPHTCPRGLEVMVNGVKFRHHPEVPAPIG